MMPVLPLDPAPLESGLVLLFNRDQQLLHSIAMTGENDCIEPPWREITRCALIHDCAWLMIEHNHPSGDPRPSVADICATRALCRMLRPLRIRLADHLIRSGDRHFSFRANGLL